MKKPMYLAFLSLMLLGCPSGDDRGPVRIDSFVVTPLNAEPAATVSLSWQTTNAQTVEVFAFEPPEGDASSVQEVVGETTRTDSDTEVVVRRSTRFVLLAHGRNDEQAEATVTVDETAGAGIVIHGFFVEPTSISLVAEKEADRIANLQWATGGADTIDITFRPVRYPPPVDPIWSPVPGYDRSATSGSLELRNYVESTEFRLTATAGDRSIFATTTLTVFGPTPVRPVIESFTASPATIDSGGTSTLTWEVRDAVEVELTPMEDAGGLPIITGFDGEDDAESGTCDATPAVTTRFTLTAISAQGFLDIDDVTVAVTEGL